jgi:hypothetical protein
MNHAHYLPTVSRWSHQYRAETLPTAAVEVADHCSPDSADRNIRHLKANMIN